MSRGAKVIAALVICSFLFAPATRAVTLSEAQSLPVSELASLVLGEVGRLYKEVSRPSGLEDYSISIPPNAKKRLSVLTFYGPASLASSTGLCSAHQLTVYFDDAGSPRDFHDSETYRYAEEDVINAPSDAKALYRLRRDEAKSCAAIASTKRFFFAAGGSDYADRAAAAIVFAIKSHKSGQKIKGSIACADLCGQGDLYDRISLEAISQIDPVDCKTGHPAPIVFPVLERACFRVTLNDQPFSLDVIYLETEKLGGEVRATSFSASMGGRKVY